MPASCEQAITLTGDLHARPAGALAVAAATFASAVSLAADGSDAEEAVATIVAILAEATRVGA